LDLLFERVDGHLAAVRVGTARAARDSKHLVRLLVERLETVDPGLGVEAMRLVVPLAESLRWQQQDGDAGVQDVSRLVDRLANRLGEDRIFRAGPQQSEVPEQSIRRAPPETEHTAPPRPDQPPAAKASLAAIPARSAPALAVVASCSARPEPSGPQPGSACGHLHLVETAQPPADADPPIFAWKRPGLRREQLDPSKSVLWPSRLQAPARLLDPPRRIEALAALPDQPPIAFTWRRRRHRVRRADGPERVHGEWWRTEAETQSIRDYFQVEDESGQRFWLFRAGNGLDSRTGDLSWFLHGLF
jgi:protein ImuB